MNDSLKLFQTEADYELAKPDFVYPIVSYVKDVDQVKYMGWYDIPMNVIFYDNTNAKLVRVPSNEIKNVGVDYEPIGLEVIPASHNVYGDGSCGVISLVAMSCDTPDVGMVGDYTHNRYMAWGPENNTISYKTYDTINTIYGKSVTHRGILPTDYGMEYYETISNDGYTKYVLEDSDYFSPSPYNADGSRNEAYYTTAYSTGNALSDFDGFNNTKTLIENATAQSDWKTADTIIYTADSAGYYPAACCCWRFHTPGTEQGQWYLPAAGEFGYVLNRFGTLRNICDILYEKYPEIGDAVHSDRYPYWLSTTANDIENNRIIPWQWSVEYGTISSGDMEISNPVTSGCYAFTKLKL